MLDPSTVKLEPEQIQKAAKLGVSLLTRPGAINIPSHLALAGEIQVLHLILRAISTGQLELVVPAKEQPGEESVHG